MEQNKKVKIGINTKFIIFFILLFLILNSLSLFIGYNYKETIRQYNHIQERFFLLNDVSQKSAKTYESMNTYLNKKLESEYDQYIANRQQLIEAKNLLVERFIHENNYISIKNYYNLIDTLIEESDAAINGLLKNDIEIYSAKQKEAFLIIGFIQDQTLSLLNDDLSMFHTYYEAINMKNGYMQLTLLFMATATFSLGLLIAYMFSNSITKPIYRLISSAREVANGKLDGTELPEANDEIGFLSKTFNAMRTDLSYYVRKIKEKSEQDKLLKEMELKSLQSQINPHFLFNTLNAISKTALIEGSDTVYKLINSLSKLLRYNLGIMGKPVTLLDEIKVVEQYFYIQKTRFEDRVDFAINISKECLTFQIPILTLQPLVENAFIHGIEPYEKKGVIEIEAYSEGEYVIIKIRDNGIGMNQQKSNMILDISSDTSSTKNTNGHSTGIGVKNVIKRLELFYHSKANFVIESAEGSGTTVQLILPKNY